MSTELVINPRVAQWTVEALTRLVATYAILQGVAVALSTGTDRFAAEQYRTAVMLPGFPESWGVALTLAGVVALVGSLLTRCRWTEYGAYAISAWSLFFTLSILDAVHHSGAASFTPLFVHGTMAVIAALAGVTYRQSRK